MASKQHELAGDYARPVIPEVMIQVVQRWHPVAVGLAVSLLVVVALLLDTPKPTAADSAIIAYDSVRYPNIECVAGRVLAETDPRLSAAQRDELWREYGLSLSFEWVEPDTGFTWHELEVDKPSLWAQLLAVTTRSELPPRELVQLVELLSDDPRVTWAAPDALVLEWCDSDEQYSQMELGSPTSDIRRSDFLCILSEPMPQGVSFVDERGAALEGGLATWLEDPELPDPLPDFEYYLWYSPEGSQVPWPEGSQVPWADELSQHDEFMQRCAVAYGNGYRDALAAYQELYSPLVSPVTVCIADTGIEFNHPDLAARMHPNAIDANFRNYRVTGARDRPDATEEITDREVFYARGLPRAAIKGSPASHGTEVAGVLARCTEGFTTADGEVRILPASLKSSTTMAISGTKVKSPISSFVKLVACLHREFPVGAFTPDGDEAIQNTGDVRVVSVSASVPKSYFSDAEWRIVASIAGKAAGSIAEDLRDNDRLYLFAAGNEAMGAPSRPGDVDYVLAVSASMAYDGSAAWSNPATGEGSNMGAKCVSAPGYGIITSNLTGGPNLAYLAAGEVSGRDNFSTPARDQDWYIHTNSFGATSAATPQVAALAALLYAQDPTRDYAEVIKLIQASTEGRTLSADWGESMGLIDYQHALGW